MKIRFERPSTCIQMAWAFLRSGYRTTLVSTTRLTQPTRGPTT
jgi:hypothetical protein